MTDAQTWFESLKLEKKADAEQRVEMLTGYGQLTREKAIELVYQQHTKDMRKPI